MTQKLVKARQWVKAKKALKSKSRDKTTLKLRQSQLQSKGLAGSSCCGDDYVRGPGGAKASEGLPAVVNSISFQGPTDQKSFLKTLPPTNSPGTLGNV